MNSMVNGYSWRAGIEIQIISLGDFPEARRGRSRPRTDAPKRRQAWPAGRLRIHGVFSRRRAESTHPPHYGVAPRSSRSHLAVRALLAPILHDDVDLPVLRAGRADLGRRRRPRARPAGDGLSLVAGVLRADGDCRLVQLGDRSTPSPLPLSASACPGAANCCIADRAPRHCDDARRAGARGASAIDPRHGAGSDDRHRRARHHAVLQQRGRAPVRLCGRRSDRQERQDPDALALPREPRRLSAPLHGRPASAASSASAAWWSASARTARPFRWSLRSAR